MNVAIYLSKLSNKKMSLKRRVERLRPHYGSIRRMEVVRDSDGSDTEVIRRKNYKFIMVSLERRCNNYKRDSYIASFIQTIFIETKK